MRKNTNRNEKNICLDVFAFLLPFFSFSCLLKDREFCSTFDIFCLNENNHYYP